MMRFFAVLAAFLAASFSAYATQPATPVLVSIAPQKYLVDAITSRSIPVTVLVTPGSDPHSYEPGPSQMISAEQADIYFTLGLPFEETWLPKLQGAASKLQAVSCIQGITRLHFAENALQPPHSETAAPHSAPLSSQPSTSSNDRTKGHSLPSGTASGTAHESHASGFEDPHVWLSPQLMKHMAGIVAQTLMQQYPDNSTLFQKNLRTLEQEIDALDKETALAFASFPEQKRVFATYHPTWNYFARDYGLTVINIETDGKEPGPQTMKKMIDRANELGVPVIFIEPQYTKNSATAVARSIHAVLAEIDPLQENWPDTIRSVRQTLVTAFAQSGTQR